MLHYVVNVTTGLACSGDRQGEVRVTQVIQGQRQVNAASDPSQAGTQANDVTMPTQTQATGEKNAGHRKLKKLYKNTYVTT